MPKIALIYLGRKGSGGPISLALGQALAVRGAELSAYLSSGLESLPAWENAGFALTCVDTFHNPLQAAWTVLHGAPLRRLAAQVRAAQPDLLLFPMLHPWNADLQRLLHPLPAVVMVHDPRPHPGLNGWLQACWEDRSLGCAARCLVLSAALQPELLRRGVPPERIRVVPHGPLVYPLPQNIKGGAVLSTHPSAPIKDSAAQFDPSPPAGRGAEDSPSTLQRLLFFGRIEPYKGLEVLLQAFEQLQPRWPGLTLTVAGEGDLRPYQAQIDRLGGRVEVISGWIPEPAVAGLFAQAGLLVLPYTSASQSGVLAIAAGFGLPVVATRTGGLAGQVRDGETGLLVEPGSAEALASGIARLLTAPAWATGLGAALRADFAGRQSWAAAVEAVLELVPGV